MTLDSDTEKAPQPRPQANFPGKMRLAFTQWEELPLQKLDQFLDRHIVWEIDKGMNMIGVYVIDLHVNALGVGVFSKVTGEAGCSVLVE